MKGTNSIRQETNVSTIFESNRLLKTPLKFEKKKVLILQGITISLGRLFQFFLLFTKKDNYKTNQTSTCITEMLGHDILCAIHKMGQTGNAILKFLTNHKRSSENILDANTFALL